jgi:hypothetical protein
MMRTTVVTFIEQRIEAAVLMEIPLLRGIPFFYGELELDI